MQGTIKIEVSEQEKGLALEVECDMVANREVCFRILNTLMTESFGMDDGDIMMFLMWRKLLAGKSESVKVDLGKMRMREEKK